MVKLIHERYKKADTSDYKILILSCSTLHHDWGDFDSILSKEIEKGENSVGNNNRKNVIFSTAGVGFSSADNLNCYRLLSDLKFDLVVFYGGINDSRFNNCPSQVFKPNYGHLPWNNEINTVLRHPEMNYFVIPFFIDYTYQLFIQKINKTLFIPEYYSYRIDWWQYGSSFKSLPVFERNIQTIQQIGKQKNETLLFVSYCFFSPENYSLANFKAKKLSYTFQTNSRETEIWGYPKNVCTFLNSSNNILQKTTSNEDYFLELPSISSNHNYFADICHFSPSGMNAFGHDLAEKIKGIKKKEKKNAY